MAFLSGGRAQVKDQAFISGPALALRLSVAVQGRLDRDKIGHCFSFVQGDIPAESK